MPRELYTAQECEYYSLLNIIFCKTLHLSLAPTLLENDDSSSSVSRCEVFSGLIKANRRQNIRCGVSAGGRDMVPGDVVDRLA